MNKKKQEEIPLEEMISATDMVELKRDMQSAQVTDWLQKNQQQLIAGAVVFVLLLVGFSLWQEQQRTIKGSAALLYMKAVNTADETERGFLLDSVIKDYAETGYATLAKLRKAASKDAAVKQTYLETLISSHGAPELAWQARLDLAELHIDNGQLEAAEIVLEERLGKQYEQARFYLLSRLASDNQEKADLIQKSLDAESFDNDLVAELEAELALLRAAK